MENGIRCIAGDKQPNMYQVKLELAGATCQFSSLLVIFTEMWLMCNCKSSWYIENLPNRQAIVGFQDPKEAIFFKLSKQFDRAVGMRTLQYTLFGGR